MSIDAKAHLRELLDPAGLFAQRVARAIVQSRGIKGKIHGAHDLVGKSVGEVEHIAALAGHHEVVAHRRLAKRAVIGQPAHFSEIGAIDFAVGSCAGHRGNEAGKCEIMFHEATPLIPSRSRRIP